MAHMLAGADCHTSPAHDNGVESNIRWSFKRTNKGTSNGSLPRAASITNKILNGPSQKCNPKTKTIKVAENFNSKIQSCIGMLRSLSALSVSWVIRVASQACEFVVQAPERRRRVTGSHDGRGHLLGDEGCGRPDSHGLAKVPGQYAGGAAATIHGHRWAGPNAGTARQHVSIPPTDAHTMPHCRSVAANSL